ncbi:MAG: hypothetical protein CMP76_16145 [Flavobacterium sp.]|uniref:DUF6438 domain-containing protein n=1 Tax=Flavobacterium sp. TaxID=239 RepID=UPI000C3D3211|nr:DUF6438 domain-containing protein [Flavobacterium sp.]MBF04813.1 hypothetical protein [Flavobacterium sp.]|tara:strand:- start:68 stop:1069 length:1002 start_codon:yes stop_codon:yes gene_type:complete
MKLLKLFIVLTFFISCKKKDPFIKAKAIKSEIDTLETQKDIENYIHKIDTIYKKFELKKIEDFDRGTEDSLNKILAKKVKMYDCFLKSDFDNNGLTDLLIIGDNHDCISFRPGIEGEKSCDYSTLVLMNYNNKINVIDINKNRHYPIVPKVEYENGEAFLMIYTPKTLGNKFIPSEKESKTKLTFKYGNFIEYNENQEEHNIEKIEYSTSGCYGVCPIFKLEINKDKSALFIAQHFNFDDNRENYSNKEEGKFKTIISKEKFNELNAIINYIDFVNLKNSYSVNWTDNQSSTLKITYDNGKTKTIGDYGLIGTYGLKRVYELLFDLRKNQDWK